MSFVKMSGDIFRPVLSSEAPGRRKIQRQPGKYAEILEAAAISPAIDLVDIEYSSPLRENC